MANRKKQTEKAKSFTCHHGKGSVIDKGHKTECNKRSGRVCSGSGSKCTRI